MKLYKLLIYLLFSFQFANSGFSQSESNDTILTQIESFKDLFRTYGISKLDKIEGIYYAKEEFTSSGSTDPKNNKTQFLKVYIVIKKNSRIEGRFDIYQYSDGFTYAGKFYEPGFTKSDSWFIRKDLNRYYLYGNSNNYVTYRESEVTFTENNISFTQIEEMKILEAGVVFRSSFNTSDKIFPKTENIFKTGTGFIISKMGYIITNFHVISKASNIFISNTNIKRMKADIKYVDEYNDIAILKIDYPIANIPYNIIGTNKEIGNNVFTLGFPFIQSMGKEVKLTNGIINSNSGYEDDKRYYQFSAEIQPGNSGGPLFDSEGNVVGLVSAKHTQATNAGYALKSKYLIDFIKLNEPSILRPNVNSLKNLNLTAKYQKLKDFVLLLEVE